jgi:hypothetical protein
MMVTRSWVEKRANGILQLSDPSVVDKIIDIVHQSKKK